MDSICGEDLLRDDLLRNDLLGTGALSWLRSNWVACVRDSLLLCRSCDGWTSWVGAFPVSDASAQGSVRGKGPEGRKLGLVLVESHVCVRPIGFFRFALALALQFSDVFLLHLGNQLQRRFVHIIEKGRHDDFW